MSFVLWCVAVKQPNGSFKLMRETAHLASGSAVLAWAAAQKRVGRSMAAWKSAEAKKKVKMVKLEEVQDDPE